MSKDASKSEKSAERVLFEKAYYIPEGSPVAPSKYDVRVRSRYLSQGKLEVSDLKAHIESLPDDAANCDLRSLEAIFNDEESITATGSRSAASPSGVEGDETTH